MKINFTEVHLSRLKELSLKMLLKNITFKGTVGTELNVHDLFHNTTVNTLVTFNGNLKKEIERLSNLDEWSLNDYQQRQLEVTKESQEFLSLLIGYKKWQSELDTNKTKLRELKAKYKEIKESTMTPGDKLAAIAAQMKELGEEEPTEDSTVETKE